MEQDSNLLQPRYQLGALPDELSTAGILSACGTTGFEPCTPLRAPQTMRVPAVDDPFVRILRGTRLDELHDSAPRAAGPAASTLFSRYFLPCHPEERSDEGSRH